MLLLLAYIFLIAMTGCGSKEESQSHALPSNRVGVCYRHLESCQREVRVIEPSTDAELNEAAVAIIAEGRMPEPCGGGASGWQGIYVYKSGAYQAQPTPDCSTLSR